MSFSLTWWSLTFPVETCVTAVSGLAAHTGSAPLGVAAVIGYGCLIAARLTVAPRTAHGTPAR